MAYGLPSRGQADWDDELNNSMEALHADVQTAVSNAASAQSNALYARDRADAVHTAVLGAPDAAVAALVEDTESDTSAALSATYEAGRQKVIYVSEDGNDAWNGLLGSHAKKTLAAALTAMGADTPGVIICAPNVIDCGSGVSLSGYACGIIGIGYGLHETTNTMKGTVLKATAAQTGPVLDFTGWKVPGSMRGRVEFGGFTVEGDNTADATKAHKGIRFSGSAIYAHDITAWKTGGACFDFDDTQLSDFARLVAVTPVSAKANDVPYMMGTGAMNGNRFHGLGFRSTTASDDTGVSGALVLVDDGTYSPHINTFDSTWFEYLHVPNGGCLMKVKGSKNVFVDTQFFDCSKEAGATGTTHWRFSDAAAENFGANIVRGYVPGTQGGLTIDSGVELNQSGNVVVGIKGFNGTNVILGSGVNRCAVILNGSEATATAVGVTDNSGTQTNTIVDTALATERHGTTQWERDTTTGDFRVSRTDSGAVGLTLGPTGSAPRVFTNASATPTNLTARADVLAIQGLDGTAIASFAKAFAAGLSVTAPAGQKAIQATGIVKIVSGGLQRTTATKTANYAMAYATDDVIVANGSSITITLPRADFAEVGRAYTVKNIHSTACTIATLNSNTIDGAASDSLAQWAAGRYLSDGTNWIKL